MANIMTLALDPETRDLMFDAMVCCSVCMTARP